MIWWSPKVRSDNQYSFIGGRYFCLYRLTASHENGFRSNRLSNDCKPTRQMLAGTFIEIRNML